MTRKLNRYNLKIEQIEPANVGGSKNEPLFLEVESHDELFSIVERAKSKNLFAEQADAAQFAVGLKLFSEIMLKNRGHELFADLAPAFGAFMRKLKAS